jgi:catalase
MEGFGLHTFRLVNARGKSTFVKFDWKPKLGMQSVVWNEAVKINGADPDFHRRDLWNATKSGHFPEWELGLQLFDQDFADKFDFDVFDATKIIPEEDPYKESRTSGARSLRRQFLCRDRRSGVLHGECGAGRRFQQRPTSPRT